MLRHSCPLSGELADRWDYELDLTGQSRELLNVPVGEAETQYQRTASLMTSGGKR